MKRSIATAAVCGASLFGFTAVAGAVGPPLTTPNPSDTAPLHTVTACNTVSTHNTNVDGVGTHATPPGMVHFLAVGSAFCGF